ncbi:MAG: type II secretion system protein [Verrucomicrobia bacterium]|nr:type II secretion system protein [Verrucomicrobiota bacterium]
MRTSPARRAFTLVELMVTIALFSVVGLILFSLFYTGTILGAKNTAVNTAHQQARNAMLNMLQDIHSAVSLPALTDANGNVYSSPPPNAAGVSFQKWSSGPHKIKSDAAANQNQVVLQLTTGANNPTPVAGQHLVIPSWQLEADIQSVSGGTGSFVVTLQNIYGPALTPPVSYPVQNLPPVYTDNNGKQWAVYGTASTGGDITCFVTNRYTYYVSNNNLLCQINGQPNPNVISYNVTSSTPFSIPQSGASYYRVGISLFNANLNYTNRSFQSVNVVLNGNVPQRAVLTTYQ